MARRSAWAFGWVALLGTMAGGGRADVLYVEDSQSSMTGKLTLTLPQFNPALGTLTGVSITESTQWTVAAEISNDPDSMNSSPFFRTSRRRFPGISATRASSLIDP